MIKVVQIIRYAVLITVLSNLAQAAESQWGTIKGQVTVTGPVPQPAAMIKKGEAVKDPEVCGAADIPDETVLVDPQSKGLANVVVFLKRSPPTVHPDLVKSKNKEVEMKVSGCRLIPHVLLVRTDQKVRLFNNDAIAHNVRPLPRKSVVVNSLSEPKDAVGILLTPQGEKQFPITSVYCDVHSWIRAYWVVLDHPYAAVTNTKGEFEIANLPVGEHEFQIWHEKIGFLDKSYKVTVRPSDNKLKTIELTSKTLLGLEKDAE